MSDDLATAQARLVDALLEQRVPEGFEARGTRATARILMRKRRKRENHERNHPPRTWLARLRSWWNR